MPFEYTEAPQQRRHGPLGYTGANCHQRYAPWLRDEFAFRCVYCLIRERWIPGQGERLNVFSVDHLLPKDQFPELRCDYENLLYCCRACNNFKANSLGVVNPCEEPYGKHLLVQHDGSVHALSNKGRDLIDICNLNRSTLVAARLRLLSLFRLLDGMEGQQAQRLRQDFFGFPDDLPDLSHQTPPGGNIRPEGVATSFHAQRERGELPQTY